MSWASAVGGVVGGLIGANGAKAANDASWAHQKELYQNRYQWQVADMRKAGLNPVLAASGGGLSAPSVSAPPVQNESAPMMEGIGMALNSAISLIQAQAAETTAEANKKNAETEERRVRNEEFKTAIDEYLARKRAENMEHQNALFDSNKLFTDVQAKGFSAKNQAEIDKIYSDIQNSTKIVVGQLELMKSQGALNYAQAQLAVKNLDKLSVEITGKHLDNELLLRELQDPEKANRRTYLTSTLGELLNIGGNVIKDLTPFRFGIGLSNR